MDWNELKGQWKQFKGDVKMKWGKFSDDELTQLDGNKDHFIGKLQEKYGYKKDQAEKEATDFVTSLRAKAENALDKNRRPE